MLTMDKPMDHSAFDLSMNGTPPMNASSLNKSPDPHSVVERLELHAVCIAPLGSKSGEERWEAAQALREAATIISELQAERDRIERNRDMWKGQCERQAASLATMRDLLTRVDSLGRTNAWRRMPTGGSFNATALGQDIASAIRSSLTNGGSGAEDGAAG